MEFNDGLYYFDITNGSVSLFTEDGKQSLLTQSEASKWIEILNLDE